MRFVKIPLALLFTVNLLFANGLFTKEQKEYLSSKKVITMCVDPSWEPFEYIQNGEHKGIIADIFQEFRKKLPIPIKLIETQTWEESLTGVKKDRCDILAAAAKTIEREKYLDFTKPYLVFPQVLATKVDEPFIDDFQDIIYKKIGVVKDSAIAELLKQKYPNINLVDVKNLQDGLYKVSSGELFGFVNTSAAISYAIAKIGMSKSLKIAAKAGLDYYLSTAVKDEQLITLEIFNILINDLDKNKLKNIKNEWLNVRVESVVDYSILYQLVAGALVIILIILYWNKTLKKEIEKRKKAQKELDKFLQVIEQTPISVMITDKNGIIEYANPFCSKKTQYTNKELTGTNANILKSGEQDSSFYKELWDTIKGGNNWHGEFQNRKKSGEIFWERAVIAPLFDRDGDIVYFAAIKDDITQSLKEKDELKFAKKEADDANSAKSDFLAKMSHEIRTPMNAVLGMLYLLEETKVNNIQYDYIKKAKHAAKSLLGIINDILDFSKIEAGKFHIEIREFDFNDMIENVLSVMGVKAEEKGLELLAYYDHNIPKLIQSDMLRVEQILNNLLSNAIKFTKKGEVLLSTKLLERNKDSVRIEFCVKDTGIGILKEHHEILFEEFMQVDNTQTRFFQGTGLGLAISKRLAKLLGGDIWIEESKPDKGSTFCFTIECKVSQDKIVDKNRFELMEKVKALKCLIVDDSLSAIDILEKMLLNLGYSVVSTANPKDVLRLVNENRFDMIFLDYKMDILNGVECYKLIEDIVKANDIKTIIVTAYTKDILKENIDDLGIDAYLSKPISPSSLYDKILEVYYSKSKPTIVKDDHKSHQGLNGLKVLLAEDNDLNRDFALETLHMAGIDVDCANDGIEVISMIKSKEYDAVLMDIQMPHMDGLETTKHIRDLDDPYFKQIPIFAVSANALIDDKQKSIEAGMQEHIIKPINPNLLFETLKRYVRVDNTTYINGEDSYKDIQENNDSSLANIDTGIFDINEAMSRINGNKKLYIKILKQFKQNYKDVYDDIIFTLENETLEQTHIKIHEIKGISANISATILFDTLKLIDIKLKDNIYPDKKLLQTLKYELDNVFTNIDRLDIEDIDLQKFDKIKVIKLLDEIRDNLDSDIGRVESILDILLPYLKDGYDDFASKLTEALDQFDTSKAEQLILGFKKGLDNGG